MCFTYHPSGPIRNHSDVILRARNLKQKMQSTRIAISFLIAFKILTVLAAFLHALHAGVRMDTILL